jgi:hypothetical protein
MLQGVYKSLSCFSFPNELFFGTARLSLNKKQVKKSTKRKNNKRWYDRSLQELRMSVDHYSRLLSFNP